MRRGAVLAAALLGLTGCFNIDVVAPPGADITLMSSKEKPTVRREYRTWFVVWGMAPLDNRMPELVLAHEKLTDARIVVEDNVPDALLGVLYALLIPIGLVTQTVIVEGNRAPLAPHKP